VYSFGDASDGCLGVETALNQKSIDQPTLITKLGDQKIVSIAAGPRHTACISEEGELYCWGFNYYDQLGLGENQKKYHM
jgi:alpha-tubulin suppressor-like RCC1 family protein